MVSIDTLACRGCGACVEVCPTGAITMRGQVAWLDATRCTECGACAEACPEQAITLTAETEPSRAVLPTAQAEVVEVVPPAAAELSPARHAVPAVRRSSPMLRRRLWPVLGSAALWAGREIAPRLAQLALDAWERRAAGDQVSRRLGLRAGSGRRLRLRRRNRSSR